MYATGDAQPFSFIHFSQLITAGHRLSQICAFSQYYVALLFLNLDLRQCKTSKSNKTVKVGYVEVINGIAHGKFRFGAS